MGWLIMALVYAALGCIVLASTAAVTLLLQGIAAWVNAGTKSR